MCRPRLSPSTVGCESQSLRFVRLPFISDSAGTLGVSPHTAERVAKVLVGMSPVSAEVVPIRGVAQSGPRTGSRRVRRRSPTLPVVDQRSCAHPEAGVHHEGAGWRGDDRVAVHLGDLGEILGQSSEPKYDVDQRVDVDRRSLPR